MEVNFHLESDREELHGSRSYQEPLDGGVAHLWTLALSLVSTTGLDGRAFPLSATHSYSITGRMQTVYVCLYGSSYQVAQK